MKETTDRGSRKRTARLPIDVRLNLISGQLADMCHGCSSGEARHGQDLDQGACRGLMERAGNGGEEAEQVAAFARSEFPRVEQAIPVARALVEAALEELPGRPMWSERWARLAFALLEGHAEPEAFEVSAHALAFAANARRVLQDPAAARDLIAQARNLVKANGMRDPLVAGDLDLIEGLLLTRERLLGDAVHLLHRAAACFACAGEPAALIRALISLSLALNEDRQHAEAFRVGTVALHRSRQAGLPRVEPFCRFNLALFQYEAGDINQALTMLTGLYPAQGAGGGLDTRIRWLEARLLGATGRINTATRLLWGLYETFVQDGAFYDAILAVIDLTVLTQQVGDLGQIADLEEALVMIDKEHAPRLSDEARSALARLRKSLAVFDPGAHEADLRTLHLLSGASPGVYAVSAVGQDAHT